MNTIIKKPLRSKAAEPHFTFHPSFQEPGSEHVYGDIATEYDNSLGFMPDEVTRLIAKRMHYAAWRSSTSTTRQAAKRWRSRYHEERNRIVVGNHKLIHRAVQKWASSPPLADDLAGECQIVLIKAVAAFNPWLGVRFSTYAFTCLMRALSRMSQRLATDRLSLSLSLETLPRNELYVGTFDQPVNPCVARLRDYFRDEASLLTPREKLVISRRFHLDGEDEGRETLEQVGRQLGLSKERVRQVQKSALLKLRVALTSAIPMSQLDE
ncbi:MAG: sigma-70 family RNA polymerase sigma factor [Gemmataceae bacterium]